MQHKRHRFPRGTAKKFIFNRRSTIVHEVCKQLAENSAASCSLPQEEKSDCHLRSDILNLDGKCEYCESRKAETTDHFYPLVRKKRPTGYCNDIWNSIPCCKECNSSKGGKTYYEWFNSKTSAYNPARAPLAKITGNTEVDDEASSSGETEYKKKNSRSRVWDKFTRYDEAFKTRCKRSAELHDAWWSNVCQKIDEFLTYLQEEVDDYSSMTHATINPVT